MTDLTHADVLDADELELWRAFRAARGQADGRRDGAVETLARQFGLEIGPLNARLADMKRRLVDAGVVERWGFYLVDDDRGVQVVSVVKGSAAHDCYVPAGAPSFPSRRFANNALFAVQLHRALPADQRAAAAAAIGAAADDESKDPGAAPERMMFGTVAIGVRRGVASPETVVVWVGIHGGSFTWSGNCNQLGWVLEHVAAADEPDFTEAG